MRQIIATSMSNESYQICDRLPDTYHICDTVPDSPVRDKETAGTPKSRLISIFFSIQFGKIIRCLRFSTAKTQLRP